MPRLAYIDGLRAIAALLVLLTHAWAFSGAPALGVSVGGHTIVLAAIPAIGYVGVNLFLVLSGFCLMWPFACDPAYRTRMSARAFWIRRWQRIAPAYFASIPLVMSLIWLEHSLAARHLWPSQTFQSATFADLWTHLLFVHNLSPDHVSTINGSYWSLALEFQLYLLFPLLFEAARRWGIFKVIVAVLVLELSFRLWLENAFTPAAMSDFDFVLPKSVFGRWLDFACGMGAATLVARFRDSNLALSKRKNWLALSALVPLGAAFVMATHGGFSYAIADVLWSIGFSMLVCWAACEGTFVHQILSWRHLAALGVMSYSLYLIHQPLIEGSCAWICAYFRPGTAFLLAMVAAVVIVFIAAGFYLLCEKRAVDFFASRRKRVTKAPLNHAPTLVAADSARLSTVQGLP